MNTTKRNWLNPARSDDTGAISTYTETRDRYSKKPYLDASLSIWDCGRKISLDFSAYRKRDINARLRKIAIIREHLAVLEAGLIKTRDALDVYKPEPRKRRKKTCPLCED